MQTDTALIAEPAFPIADVYGPDGCGISQGSRGMTLRDYFAGQALASFNSPYRGPDGDAKKAYEIADAMLALRAKGAQS